MNLDLRDETTEELKFTEPSALEDEVKLTPIAFKVIREVNPPAAPAAPKVELPPEEWVRRIAIACLEVVHGRRNVSQLKSITSARVSQTLMIRHSVQMKRKVPINKILVGRIRMCQPHPHAIEASTTFLLGEKAFPLALRLESAVNGWKITACEIGPH
ncbi:MAG: hypothetical protein RIS75_1239 [Actinomycetota bacterium]